MRVALIGFDGVGSIVPERFARKREIRFVAVAARKS
jgi:hypothetical protein